MDTLRDAITNIGRRKIRSILAIFGIGVGVFVLIIIGAMSEYFRSISDHFRRTFIGRIFLCEKMSFWAGGGIFSDEKVDIIKDIPGITEVIPLLIGRIDREEMFALGMPNVLVGVPQEKAQIFIQNAPLHSGRWFQKYDGNAMVAGYDIAAQYSLKPGDTMTIRGKPFKVTGILKKTGTLEDRQAIVPLDAAQEALLRPHLLTCLVVIPENEQLIDSITDKLKNKLPWILVITSKQVEEEVNRNLIYWETLMVTCLMLSGITSFLSVSVIMIIAITERRREIGLKKALGAENIHIFTEYLMEVFLLCILGWAVGVLLGEGFISFYRCCFVKADISLFLITPRLIIGSLFWSLIIGIFSGYLSAKQAVSIEPIKSLRQV